MMQFSPLYSGILTDFYPQVCIFRIFKNTIMWFLFTNGQLVVIPLNIYPEIPNNVGQIDSKKRKLDLLL